MADAIELFAAVIAATVTAIAAIATTTTTTAAATTEATRTAEAAAAAATEATLAAATTAKLPRRALFTRPGDVHRQCAAFERVAVELLHGLLGLLRTGHGDEGETTGTPREFVEDDFDDADSASLTEQGFKVLRGAGEWEIAHVEL